MSFQDTLCEPSGLLGFTSHHKEQDTGLNEVPAEDNAECEKMMITLDQESPNELLDNILYYIGGHIVQKLLTRYTVLVVDQHFYLIQKTHMVMQCLNIQCQQNLLLSSRKVA